MSSFANKRVITAAALVLLFGTPAYAGIHLQPPGSAPTFTDEGVALEATGLLAGLGDRSGAKVNMTAEANVTATCTNPSGQNQPPGQNPAPISVTGSETIEPGSIDHNGSAPFDVTAGLTSRTIKGAPDCPNGKWTEFVQDLAFTSAVITVVQGGVSTTVATCTFSPPTSDGTVPANTVSCK
jgi:hypothetical protein